MNAGRAVLAVVTRDRAALFERCLLPSIVQAAGEGVPIVVVDQSAGPETRRLVETVPGARYFRSGPGLSCGRNVAVGATTQPVIVFTDDDVSFKPGWFVRLVATFDEEPTAGAVCGRAMSSDGELLPGAAAGVYRHPTSPFGLGSGFNVAFRREALEAAGPFDEALGAGARYRSGEDTDMLYRVMRAGWSVVCSDDIMVVHDDWRPSVERLRQSFSYGVGAGAQTAKHVAANDRTAAAIAQREAARHLVWLGRRLTTTVARDVALQLCYLTGLAVGFARRRRELAGAAAGRDEPGIPCDDRRRHVDEAAAPAPGDEQRGCG